MAVPTVASSEDAHRVPRQLKVVSYRTYALLYEFGSLSQISLAQMHFEARFLFWFSLFQTTGSVTSRSETHRECVYLQYFTFVNFIVYVPYELVVYCTVYG